MLTVNGRVRWQRVRWHCPQDGSETPLDRLLDATEAAISAGGREMACRLNQSSSSFTASAANLRRAAHLEISKESLRHLVETEGKTVLKRMQQGELLLEWSAEDCVSEQGPTRAGGRRSTV